MDLNRLLAGGGFPGMGRGQGAGVMGDTPQVDNSEIIYISPLSLLKVCRVVEICLTVDVETRSSGSPNGSHGFDAGRIRR